jgi:hypothetical protein
MELAFVVSLLLVGSATYPSFVNVAQAASSGDLTANASLAVNALTANSETLHMWTIIKSGGQIVAAGLTPLSFHGVPGRTYQLTVNNLEARGNNSHLSENNTDDANGILNFGIIFNHWQDNNSTIRTRDVIMPSTGTLALNAIYNKGERVTLHDLGVLQLVSHDLYNTNRTAGFSTEDERLNLSTLFNYGEDKIAIGGEPRNSENVAIHTIAVGLGKFYLDKVAGGTAPDVAKNMTIARYLQMVEDTYQRVFGEPFPAPAPNPNDKKPDGSDNLTADLALRTVHSFLPGHIMVNGKDTPILDPSLQGKVLSERDMKQLSKPLDGTFDPAFRHITIFLPPPAPPPNTFTIDLMERDSSFAKQFGTDFSFEYFLNELKDGKYHSTDKVMSYIREDMAAGTLPPAP